MPTRNNLIFLIVGASLVVSPYVFADYGYLTMPVDPSALSYSGGNTGINAWVDHTSPLGLADTSTIFTRYTGVQYTGSSTKISSCSSFFNGFGCYNDHEGIDYAVASGTQVFAAASGIVRQSQWQDDGNHSLDFGRFVRIWHSQYGFSTLYAHLNATTTVAGNNVARHDLIGNSGDTGDASSTHAYHLHFQVYDADVTVTSSSGSGGDQFSHSVDPFGWSPGGASSSYSSTSSDVWVPDRPFGYMWASPAATSSVYNYVSGTIANATSWKANQIYIIQGSLIVSSTATLTIPAGVVVKFDATSTYMEVDGTLKVNGTAASPVYFTSIEDDTVGGDTNDDASATTPASGQWRDIRFNAGSSSTINYATVRYGGSYNAEANPNLYLNDGKLTINSSTIDSSLDYGLYMASGTVSIANSTVSNNAGYGIRCSDGTGGNVTFTGNKFINNGLAVYLDYGPVSGLNFNPPSNNTSSGNGTNNGYRIGGYLGVPQTWSHDIPYYSAGIVIPSTTQLTVNSGTIVKSDQIDAIYNNGILNVQGTATNRVYFTSFQDDTVGGDTNGDGASSTPAGGDWTNIVTNSGATTTINYAMIRYGGLGNVYFGNLEENGGSLTVTNSTVASSSNYGVYIVSGTMNISTSTIAGNFLDGIYNNTSVTSTAQHNYWNASSGPSGVATGTGDAVTAYVNYTPFATSAVP